MPAVYVSLAWLLGIALGHNTGVHPVLALAGLVPFAALFFLKPRIRKTAALGAICFATFTGAAVYASYDNAATGEALRSYNGSGPIEIAGMVSSPPEAGGTGATLRLEARSIRLPGQDWEHISGKALLYVSRYPEHTYGEIVTAKGELITPATGEGSNYRAYLAQQDIFSVMEYPDITVTGHGGNPLLGWLLSARKALLQSLDRVLPEPEAAVAQGMVLGARADIPDALNDDFKRSGTSHIMAISGVNLTIVAGILVAITLWVFGRRHYIYILVSAAAVFVYAVLTGLQPPVLRAAIMVAFFLGAELIGRQRVAIAALSLSAVVMTAMDPGALFLVSFQLSFMSMVGIMLVAPPLQHASRSLVPWLSKQETLAASVGAIGDSLMVSVAAVAMTWPLIAHYFGSFSWVGPFATFLALPALPAIMLAAALAASFGVFVPALGQILAWAAWLPISYLLIVVRTFSHIPGASVATGAFPPALVSGYYALLAAYASVRYRKHLRAAGYQALALVLRLPRKWVFGTLALLAVVPWVFAFAMPDNRLHVIILDVGQGDSILIQRGSRQILIDGGPDPQRTLLALSRKMPFWDRTIDMVISTHPDADHLTGLIEVQRHYRVNYAVSGNYGSDYPLYEEWLKSIEQRGVTRLSPQQMRSAALGPVGLSIFNADSPGLAGDSNATSLVTRVEIGEVSFLMTGDLDVEAERKLMLDRAVLGATVLKVGHHGSATSTCIEFLEAVHPSVAVVSVGKDNTYGHPSQQVMRNLEQEIGADSVYRTDEQGSVEFITDGSQLWVRTERPRTHP